MLSVHIHIEQISLYRRSGGDDFPLDLHDENRTLLSSSSYDKLEDDYFEWALCCIVHTAIPMETKTYTLNMKIASFEKNI